MKKLNGIAVLLFGIALILTTMAWQLGVLSLVGLLVAAIGLIMVLGSGDGQNGNSNTPSP